MKYWQEINAFYFDDLYGQQVNVPEKFKKTSFQYKDVQLDVERVDFNTCRISFTDAKGQYGEVGLCYDDENNRVRR